MGIERRVKREIGVTKVRLHVVGVFVREQEIVTTWEECIFESLVISKFHRAVVWKSALIEGTAAIQNAVCTGGLRQGLRLRRRIVIGRRVRERGICTTTTTTMREFARGEG